MFFELQFMIKNIGNAFENFLKISFCKDFKKLMNILCTIRVCTQELYVGKNIFLYFRYYYFSTLLYIDKNQCEIKSKI